MRGEKHSGAERTNDKIHSFNSIITLICTNQRWSSHLFVDHFVPSDRWQQASTRSHRLHMFVEQIDLALVGSETKKYAEDNIYSKPFAFALLQLKCIWIREIPWHLFQYWFMLKTREISEYPSLLFNRHWRRKRSLSMSKFFNRFRRSKQPPTASAPLKDAPADENVSSCMNPTNECLSFTHLDRRTTINGTARLNSFYPWYRIR